jgi:hypothetical protein
MQGTNVRIKKFVIIMILCEHYVVP